MSRSTHRPRGRYIAPPIRQTSPQTNHLIAPWKYWDSLVISVGNISQEVNAYTIWNAFQKEGNVFSIDIFEDSHGKRESRGKIRFRPPPHTDFWNKQTYTIDLPNKKTSTVTVVLENNFPDPKIPSPTRPDIRYPAELRLPLASMDIGIMLNDMTMLPIHSVGFSLEYPLVLDLKKRALWIHFDLQLFYPTQDTLRPSKQEYRLDIPLVQLCHIVQMQNSNSGEFTHCTFLNAPPIYHRKIKGIANTFVDENAWRESDTWFRQTDIVHNPPDLSTFPISLRKKSPVIDIGRWTTFKITYSRDADKRGDFTLLCNILKDYNVKFERTDRFCVQNITKKPAQIWKWIDVSNSHPPNAQSQSLADLIDEEYVHLPFSVRYQLEVCLSNGYLSGFTMNREFAIKLSGLEEAQARKLLEHVATQKQVFHDPMKIFNLKFIKGSTSAKIPHYCCYMRSARVTPSTIYYETPSVEISNRIIRYYIEYTDRFLRVKFTDEKYWGRIHSTIGNTMDEVFTRIKRTLANGIVIGDRHYEFLAFGNSQFREHGAYFFAPLPGISAAHIRSWMGQFNGIRNVAKHAARLGQCFSTTRAIAGCPVKVHKIEDVIRNGYTFSDGVGRISRFLAQMVMSELKIKTFTGEPPSAFQFRLGGCKGMLAISPLAQPQEVHIRPSQNKFHATHNGLEVIRWSQFSLSSLNRQLILVLSTLGIPDRTFHKKLCAMIYGLNEAMANDTKAITLLRKYVDPNQMTLTVSQMVLDGFRRSEEPFLTSILTLWRAWHLKYLKDKARIAIEKGACLLGVIDETGILRGYFHDKIPMKDATLHEKTSALPEIFLQVSQAENESQPKVIEGICILARNPSLHTGDIRVVRAVNVPELGHLQDVVVLPQTGDQDISSMCSGGDLDGDDYLVIWDEDLIPKDWFRPPMNYTSKKARDLEHDVTVDEITSFFVTYMKNDCLPTIALSHVAWADRLDNGVDEEKCIQLAQLHSDAVDYNKTGNPAAMTRSLEPRMWPHFMEKKLPKERIYKSSKILGQLYDAVERVDFVPSLEMPFDKRLLHCKIPVTEEIYQFVRELKVGYDTALRRLMTKHDIKTEFEVWSTFVLSHANESKDYKFHEEIGMLSSSLREGFKKQCYERAGGRDFDRVAPVALAMYRVTHQEMSAALGKYYADNCRDDRSVNESSPKVDLLPLISFPWIFPNVLGKIAMGYYDGSGLGDALDADINGEVTATNGDAPGSALDPFGLFDSDEILKSQPSVHGTSNAAGFVTGDRESIEILEQLLGFGLSQVPASSSSPSASGLCPSAQVAGEPSLLDLDDQMLHCGSNLEETKPGTNDTNSEDKQTEDDVLGVGVNETQERKTEQTKHPTPIDHSLETIIEHNNKALDLVEEEGDVEPNALDKLNELLDG
ncbi:hypothetical protein FE257_006870 [Aspergillus nanangensis]|uniref:RNA-dependent RNA polymerase n=1 Tax=Aspergillus nanangensis TaxID=2582783 RepID=A0AAD4GUL1_ASPNN|nr:hypothetical protein FE257_006870 [Aspergillus nanangensis]